VNPESVSKRASGLTPSRLRATEPYRHVLLPRIVAGAALLITGLTHLFVPEAPLRPLVEAAGFPFAAVISPVGVTLKIAAGISLLLGLWARLAGLVAVPIMLGAIYAHLVIDVWPNAPEMQEPPMIAPIAVLISAGYVLWRGAGRWSLDRRHSTRSATEVTLERST
jgi:putative oxidoreductase